MLRELKMERGMVYLRNGLLRETVVCCSEVSTDSSLSDCKDAGDYAFGMYQTHDTAYPTISGFDPKKIVIFGSHPCPPLGVLVNEPDGIGTKQAQKPNAELDEHSFVSINGNFVCNIMRS